LRIGALLGRRKKSAALERFDSSMGEREIREKRPSVLGARIQLANVDLGET
jgi:hypothetical protein